MALTQLAIVNAAPKDKPYKLADGDGLHLLIQPNGSKLWRLRYRFNGQENMMSLGAFPSTSLANARTNVSESRSLLASGMNPSVKRKLDKIAAAIAPGTHSAMSQPSIWLIWKPTAPPQQP